MNSCKVNNQELLGLRMAAPGWIDDILFGSPPLWLGKLKTNWGWISKVEMHAVFPAVMEELNGAIPYLWLLLTHGQWPMPGHMVRQEGSGNLAYKRDVHMGHIALWKSVGIRGCIKVGHVDAHQKNSFPGLKVNGITGRYPPCALLRQPPASKK